MHNMMSPLGPSTAASACIGAQNNPVRGEPEAAYVAKYLDSKIVCLEARINELADRLTPILEDRPTMLDEKRGLDGQAQRAVMSPLGRGIMDVAYHVENMDRRITLLLDALAV